MSLYLFKGFLFRRLVRNFALYVILGVFVGGGWAVWKNARPQATSLKNTHYTAAEIERRALQLCLSFSDSVRIIALPQCRDQEFEAFQVGPYRSGHRLVWTAFCEVGGEEYYVDFNDLDGKLIGFERLCEDPIRTKPAINTSDEATRIALFCLHEMRIISSGANIQLQNIPIHQGHRHAWRTVWSVFDPERKEDYQILLLLSDVDGKPLRLTNRTEANQYAHDGDKEGVASFAH